MSRRVVITGIAPVTGMGVGKEEFFNKLMKKEVCIKRIADDYCKDYEGKSKWYVPYPEIDYEMYGEQIARMGSRAPLIAMTTVASALLAVKDARIEEVDDQAAVIYGLSMHNAPEWATAYKTIVNNDVLHPYTVPRMIPNTVSAWVSIALKTHGLSHVITTACASGTSAIGEAFLCIKEGRAKTVICGGVDCLVDNDGLIYKGFDILGIITKSEDGYPYPFSEERSGFLFNEGAACSLVLEDYEVAKKRGARIYAEITGYESSCDAWHIVQMEPSAEQIIKILAKISEGEKVDYYNAHGTGTELNDYTEAEIIKKLYGSYDKSPYVNSTKGFIGHTLGASGAIEAAVCAYSIKNNIVHGNIVKNPFKDINLPIEAVNADIHCALSASFGFGGHNAVLKFKKCE